jgi:hypothetical protein
MTFGAGLLLLLWVLASLLLNGIALLHRFTRLRGIELFAYGAAAGVSLNGLVGWAIAAAPAARGVFVAFLVALTCLSAAHLVWRRVLPELFVALSTPIRRALLCWLLLLLLGVSLLHLKVRFPEPLSDGIYVFKTPTTNVAVQYLTSLPADNYIPFAVSEFLLRGISFEKERPILPANEVSNRTILMSLVALPFRTALGAPYDRPELGRFSYVGRDWPDVAKLNTDGAFEQFSVIGLVLNGLLLLGAITFCANFGAGSFLPLAALLYVTNAYFIGQTIYTWPKALAGFFIFLAWNSIRAGHRPLVVAALLALAFHAHPYAIVFAAWILLFYLSQWWRGKNTGGASLVSLVAFVAILLPWFIWTRYQLRIPSDLISQNFIGPGTEAAWASPMGFIWIRLHNLFYTVCSTIFTVYPFDLGAVLNCWLFSLPGVVGLVLIFPALAQCAKLPRPRPWLWYGLLGPMFSILSVYSCPALPVLHGYQAPLAVLLFFGVWWLSQRCRRRVYLGLIGVQLLLNLGIIFARGRITGAHF